METPQPLLPYIFWDVEFSDTSSENWLAICPFCENKNSSRKDVPRFGVSIKTGAFNCFFCGKQGSYRDFLKEWYNHCLNKTTELDLRYMMSLQGIPLPALNKFKVAKASGGRYFVPYYDSKLDICDLKIWRNERKEHSTKGCNVGVFNLKNLTETNTNVPTYICGSFRNALSLDWLLNRNGASGIVVATSGENTFREEFAEFFRDRDCVVVFDNDAAGYGEINETNGKASGSKRVYLRLQNIASSLKYTLWPSEFKEGYDIRDYINEFKSEPESAYKRFRTFFRGFEETSEPNFKGNGSHKILIKSGNTTSNSNVSFAEILQEAKTTYKFTEQFESAMKVSFATVLATKLPGKSMVWLFLMGPSGSGKTEICDIFQKANRNILWESTVSKVALISGWGLHNSLVDHSILAKVNGKCLIINDFTTVLEKNDNERNEIFSIFRDAYLGFVKRPFGTGERVYNSVFGCLCGVTHAIEQFDNTPVGERFLRYALKGNYSDDLVHKAMENELLGKNYNNTVKEMTNLFFQNVKLDLDPLKLSAKIPSWFRQRLIPLSNLCALLRTGVVRHEKGLRWGKVVYNPKTELGTRIGVQLDKLALSYCLLEGKDFIDEKIYDEVCKKICKDSVPNQVFKIVRFLILNQKYKFQLKELIEHLKQDIDGFLIQDLMLLNILEKHGNTYTTTKLVNDLWTRAKL